MQSLGLVITLALILLALAVAFAWGGRYIQAYIQRWRRREPPPTLTRLLQEPVDPGLADHEQRFRRPHFVQVISLAVAAALILVSLIAIIIAEGWTLFTLLVLIAEAVLLVTHGVPLLVAASQTLTVSEQGIHSRGLFREATIDWWEVQRVFVEEDLSRFRAEGIRSRITVDTSMFAQDVKPAVIRAIRSHLARHQLDLQPWPQRGRVYRFSKAAAVNLGALLLLFLGGAFFGPEPAETPLQGPRVLGLRCGYASQYLREKYDLPEHQGCVILRVQEGGAAQKAGLGEGDLIVALEDIPISSGPQFTFVFESLDKRKQKYIVIHPSETDPVSTTVTLGLPGKLPEYDPEDPFFFYLRARGADDRSQAIDDYTRAIELDPDFDLAYVYRGARWTGAIVFDLALADFDRALELDSDLVEAYRWRAWLYHDQGDYELALADAETAIRLDNCPEAFRTYNYDCWFNHHTLAVIFGARGDPSDAQRAVEQAKTAIEFCPDMPEAYYLAAYYLSLDGREQEAREYASLFLEKAGKYEQADAKLDWAERLVSGSSVPDEAPSPAAETAKIFIDESAGADWDPKGEPTVPLVLFAEERSFEPPWGERSLKNDLRQLWAYFEFDNAAGVRAVSWDWSQNGITTSDYGIQLWPGSNKGQAWILLQNTLQGVNSRGSLKIVFDGEQVASADIYLRDDAFVSPATFYGDAAATEPVLFYKGRPNPVYVALNYVSVLPGSGLVWVAERDGARVGEGNLVLKEEAGKAIIPIDLSPDLETGLIRIHFYLDGELTRTASLALAPAQVAERPPFERFDIGMSPDGEGILAQVTKEFPPDAWQIDYVVDGIDLAPESELTIRWYREGEPLGLFEDSYTGQDGVRKAISFVAENPESGEYQVLVSLDGELVYADVVVVG